MRKIFLAGVAALSVLGASAAHATDAKLPDTMLGAWCAQPELQSDDDDAENWVRVKNVTECGTSVGTRMGISIRQNGYDYYRSGKLRSSCEVTWSEIEFLHPIYFIKATCKSSLLTETWIETFEASASGGLLKLWNAHR